MANYSDFFSVDREGVVAFKGLRWLCESCATTHRVAVAVKEPDPYGTGDRWYELIRPTCPDCGGEDVTLRPWCEECDQNFVEAGYDTCEACRLKETCPECGGIGYVDYEDSVHGTIRTGCDACWWKQQDKETP